MRPIFNMVVGLPGSGKSTFIQERALEEDVVCSSDAIREELFGSAGDAVNTKKNNELVFQTLHKRVKDALMARKNVWYDATNINRKKRMQFLQEINIPDPP